MEDDDGRGLRLVLALVLLSIVAGGTVDILLDRPGHWLSWHVAFEVMLIAVALVTATSLWLGWWRARAEVRSLETRLAEGRAERETWRAGAAQAVSGFAAALEVQFTRWSLTPVEREIALRLLEGQSHKVIAIETGRSERTVRQHAVAIYGKAGVGGRAELAAFFLGALRAGTR